MPFAPSSEVSNIFWKEWNDQEMIPFALFLRIYQEHVNGEHSRGEWMMDVEERLRYIQRVGEEIVTVEELRELLKEKKEPIAYDGFEPSGLAHMVFGVYRPLLLRDMIKAGVKFRLFLADWHAWINRKMGGDLDLIRTVGKYFIEVWKAAGVPMDKVEFFWASDLVDHSEYWKTVIEVAMHTTVERTKRCLTIMGRKEAELRETAQLLYPLMQCADIFHLECDITQLGMDQRRVNMLAREVGPKIGFWKPVVVSHHMLLGLEGPKEKGGFDENSKLDVVISSKMSKSKPESSIYVHDTYEDIKRKIRKAYCPEKQVEFNPILDYAQHIVFRAFPKMLIERPAKFGGDVEFSSYQELEEAYQQGKIHPLDLKNAVAKHLNELIAPVRKHFEENATARDLYETIKEAQVTR